MGLASGYPGRWKLCFFRLDLSLSPGASVYHLNLVHLSDQADDPYFCEPEIATAMLVCRMRRRETAVSMPTLEKTKLFHEYSGTSLVCIPRLAYSPKELVIHSM